MPELLLGCALRWSHSRIFWALYCCLILLQLCLLFKHLRSFAFSPFFTGFCHFYVFHTSLTSIFHTLLSPFSLHKLMRFLILSFISLTRWSLWAKRRYFYCLFFYRLLLFKLLYVNTFPVHKCRKFFCVAHFLCRHSRLFCCLLCCLLLLQLRLQFNHLRSSAFSPFFTGFCHFRIFHTSLLAIFHTSLSLSSLHKLMRFLILSFISPTWWSLWLRRR